MISKVNPIWFWCTTLFTPFCNLNTLCFPHSYLLHLHLTIQPVNELYNLHRCRRLMNVHHWGGRRRRTRNNNNGDNDERVRGDNPIYHQNPFTSQRKCQRTLLIELQTKTILRVNLCVCEENTNRIKFPPSLTHRLHEWVNGEANATPNWYWHKWHHW